MGHEVKKKSFMLQGLVHGIRRSLETPLTETEKTARGTY